MAAQFRRGSSSAKSTMPLSWRRVLGRKPQVSKTEATRGEYRTWYPKSADVAVFARAR